MAIVRMLPLVGALVCFTLPLADASAADFSKLLESFTGTATGWQEFDAQQGELRKVIDSAEAVGQLSKAQADDFRAQLSSLAQQEVQAKSSGRLMNFVQSLSFNKQFNGLVAQVETAIETGKQTAPDVDKLQMELKGRVDRNLAAGRISQSDADSFNADLRHVASMETAFKSESNGPLNTRQTELLLVELNKVKTRLDQEDDMADSGVRALQFRADAIEKKISDGLAQQKMSAADAASFRDELSKIRTKQNSFQSANNKLSGGQVLILAGDLDSVNGRVDSKLALAPAASGGYGGYGGRGGYGGGAGAGGDDFESKFERLSFRVNRMARSGRMSDQEVADVRHDLEQVAQLRAAFRASGPDLNPGQNEKLNRELDRINSRLEEMRGDRIGSAEPPVPPVAPPRDRDRRDSDWRDHNHHGGRDRDRNGQNPDGVNVNVGTRPEGSMSFPVVANVNFTDVQGYWAQPYINQLANRGVIGGFPNGTFKPEDKITRAQFAAIAAKALKLPAASASGNFTDLPSTHWAAAAIAAASNAGLIGGFPDGTFKPEDSLTRAQALVILSKALKSQSTSTAAMNAYSDAQAVPSWASPSVAQAADAHIIVNFPDAHQIRPNALTTRGEVAGLMYQTLSALGADLPAEAIGVAK